MNHVIEEATALLDGIGIANVPNLDEAVGEAIDFQALSVNAYSYLSNAPGTCVDAPQQCDCCFPYRDGCTKL